jgi:hypothetical protein
MDYAAERRRFDHAKQKDAAARAMLAALKDMALRPGSTPQNQLLVWQAMLDAIAQAEAAGIKVAP